MIWRIPVIWQMTGTQLVEADRLEDAMNMATDAFDATDGEFKDGSLELDCNDVEAVRAIYNGNRPDGLGAVYPELEQYVDDGAGFKLDLDREPDLPEYEYLGTYEVIFDLAYKRYYCYIKASSMTEALGLFFKQHPHITYDMIFEHLEVG